MKEETLVELLERRFVTADGVIIWDEQVKGLINGATKDIKHLTEEEIIQKANDKFPFSTNSYTGCIDGMKLYREHIEKQHK